MNGTGLDTAAGSLPPPPPVVKCSRNRWLSRLSMRLGRPIFNPHKEHLYQLYSQRRKLSDLDCFLVAACLVAAHNALSSWLLDQPAADQQWSAAVVSFAAVSSAAAAAQAALVVAIRWQLKWRAKRPPADPTPNKFVFVATYLAWFLVVGVILASIFLLWTRRWAVTWLLLINFLSITCLPLPLATCLSLTSSASLLFVAVSAALPNDQLDPTQHNSIIQQVAFVISFSSLLFS